MSIKKAYFLIFSICVLLSCQQDTSENPYHMDLPQNTPHLILPQLTPEGKLVHSGIFSPDLNSFYYTLSDQEFQKFDVMVVHKTADGWGIPKYAFFNTNHLEHGTSFSIDGRYIYFSSTRPVGIEGIPQTWHLWRIDLESKDKNPVYIDIPNLRDKLLSHPSVSSNGNLYFHAANLDYSEMYIYTSRNDNGIYSNARKLPEEINFNHNQNTPHIADNESYLLFESASKLFISYKNDLNEWSKSIELPSYINENGHGNPFISPDEKYLLYVAGVNPEPESNWGVYWVSTDILPQIQH